MTSATRVAKGRFPHIPFCPGLRPVWASPAIVNTNCGCQTSATAISKFIYHHLESTMTTLRHSQTLALGVLLAVLAALLLTLSVRDNTPVHIARPPNIQIK